MSDGPMSVGVGIIGLGARGLRSLGRTICRLGPHSGVHIAAVCDTHPQRLADGVEQLRAAARRGGARDDFAAVDSEAGLIADPAVDLVMIASPQYMHARAFVPAAEQGKLIYCEKPLAAGPADCEVMRGAWERYSPRCMVGLTRRYESVWLKARSLVAQGSIGTPRMMLLRSVIPYSRYFGGWWRDSRRSGDLLNEKSSHHFDVFNWFAGSAPASVQAVGGRSVFLPRPGYPARCSQCDRVCPYRRPEKGRQDYSQTFRSDYDDDPAQLLTRDLCVYSDEADILDHAVVSVSYPNGIQASLFFAVFGQDADDQETLEVVGDSGRLILTRETATIDLIADHGEQHAVFDCAGSHHDESHFGADRTLIRRLAQFAQGATPAAGFEDAYSASRIAFEAQDSIRDGTTHLLTGLTPVRG